MPPFFMAEEDRNHMAKFCPLFSGSSGNSYYIGSAEEGILVDAGRSAKQITERLALCGIPQQAVRAIFVTHEHRDHIQGLRVLAGRLGVPVYASPGTLGALEKMGALDGKFPVESLSLAGTACAGLRVRPFHTSHDCAEGYGYYVETSDGRSAAFATDLGYCPPEIRQTIAVADLVVMESNHDVRMLESGPYPYVLKRRILSRTGHLSNETCAQVLAELVQGKVTRIFLAHLSQKNNTPALARTTNLAALEEIGAKVDRDFTLEVAQVANPGKVTVF